MMTFRDFRLLTPKLTGQHYTDGFRGSSIV
jgi:hypothetical protein